VAKVRVDGGDEVLSVRAHGSLEPDQVVASLRECWRTFA
jgi:hypothetical protein